MNKSIIPVLSAALICLCSCSRDKEAKLTDEARELYKKTMKLSTLYSDSISNAKDSTTVNRLFADYDENLTKLNFEYPADADLDMNEGQNDTLIHASRKIVQLRDSMLKEFARRPIVVPDTIVNDSIVG